MALHTAVRTPLCRNALVAILAFTLACTTQTVTLSRWVASDVTMGDIASIAVAPWGGEAGPDSSALMSQALGTLDGFEVVAESTSSGEDGGANGMPEAGDMDAALIWSRSLPADAVLVGGLDIGTITFKSPGQAFKNEISAQLIGYVALINSSNGRALLYEPVDHIYTASADAFCLNADGEPIEVCDLAADWVDGAPLNNNAEALRLSALQDYAHTLAERLVPHFEGQEVMLYKDASLPQSEAAISALISQDWATAVTIYQNSIAQLGRWTTPPWVRARAHYNLGTTLAYGGRVEEGLVHLEKAQALAPSHVFVESIVKARAYRSGQRTSSRGHHLWQCRRGPNRSPVCARAPGP